MLQWVLVVLCVLLGVNAQTRSPTPNCPVYTNPQLCGTPNYHANVTSCNSTHINFPEFPPCCSLHNTTLRPCDDPDKPRCRDLVINTPICNETGTDECPVDCFNKHASMDLNFEFINRTQQCCLHCQCYGDPHCEDFYQNPDTWIICDARKFNPKNPSVCPMDKAECVKEKDHYGNKCQWLPKTTAEAKNWNIGLKGSPCQFNMSQPVAPQMTMYSGAGFDVVLDMGERSIIATIRIRDGIQWYVLNSFACDAYENAWTNNAGVRPPPDDPNWLPNTWQRDELDGGDVLWSVNGLKSLLEFQIRCTRTVLQGGSGPPRLNVELIEPLAPKNRVNPGGFCPNGTIEKQGTHGKTDNILKKGGCEILATDLSFAQFYCGPATTAAGVAGCKIAWCKSLFATNVHVPTSAEINSCTKSIQNVGMKTTFCLSHTAKNVKMPYVKNYQGSGNDGCTNQECKKCMSYKTWSVLFELYGNPGVVSDCLTREELPPSLIGDCQAGVSVQYLDAQGIWRTSFAIPNGVKLCADKIVITPTTDPNLFSHPMRLHQCSTVNPNCLTDKCTQEMGFEASLTVTVEPNEVADVFDLWKAGIIICNPVLYPGNPQGCLGYKPPPYCPCPPSGRRRALEEFAGLAELSYDDVSDDQ